MPVASAGETAAYVLDVAKVLLAMTSEHAELKELSHHLAMIAVIAAELTAPTGAGSLQPRSPADPDA